MPETPGTSPNPALADPAYCAAIRDDLPAHALGALDTTEARQVEAHLADCPACRADLVELELTMGILGTAVPPVTPRPEVRAALMAAIAEDPAPLHESRPAALPASEPVRRTPLVRLGRQRDRRWLWRVGLPAAACLACLALVAAAVLALLLDRALEERDDAREAQRRIAAYLGDGGSLAPLLPEPGAAADAAEGHGSLAVAPNQSRAMLFVYDLAPSEDGRRYMAWAERDRQRVRLGELTVDDDGTGYLMLYGPEPINTYEFVGIARYEPGASKGEPFLVATVPSDATSPPSSTDSANAETTTWP